MKFQVGSWYFFTIENIIDIPEKGYHFILRHDSGRKMLLNTLYYVKYNFKIGQTIECRVDKVNCTGQVFLEPRHPHYQEGSLYQFNFLSLLKSDDNSLSMRVKDLFDNEIQVLLGNDEPNLKDEMLLKVERVKKGLPILSFPKALTITDKIEVSETLNLIVVAKVFDNSEEYYSLADNTGRLVSRLKVKHYKNFGLEVGRSYSFNKRGYDTNGLALTEPENPWYKVGESYLFKLLGIENYVNLEGDEVKNVIVLDINENKCGVPISVEQLKQIENSNEIKCSVKGFRKGRPLLEIDPV